ncbi:protein mono-ADP-ribosyltransferase PARP16-like [Saccoglossus kowalevskii]|uniref:Poly [ADP-ribose] polymerase n=1 Tax=Saccoglossus kowalevskii TaxID=10224 RepID=A0ABM0GJG9_SACKO|nr:PREDICTED: mono [ADP-ribose] polymerase PARP16-like [Saccoglossus kowalevskii]
MVSAELRDRVIERLNEDPTGADIKFSLFFAAANNYRHDTVLRPFPPMFLNANGEKDFRKLAKVCKEILPVQRLLHVSDQSIMGSQAWQLMDWVLSTKAFTLKSHGTAKFEEIKQLTGAPSYDVEPTHIYEIHPNSVSDTKFEELRDCRDLLYAYHGSRVENFHSILHNGLHAHMNKNSLFGEGTYLSSDLSVTMPYAPAGKGWDDSCIGDLLSCIAVCEMIDHPDVKCTTKDSKNNVIRSRAQAPSSMGGDVPDKYYIVTNNEVLRVKYLLVYASRTVKPRAAAAQSSRLLTWMKNHQVAMVMIGYMLILLFIGFMNSSAYKVFMRKYLGIR